MSRKIVALNFASSNFQERSWIFHLGRYETSSKHLTPFRGKFARTKAELRQILYCKYMPTCHSLSWKQIDMAMTNINFQIHWLPQCNTPSTFLHSNRIDTHCIQRVLQAVVRLCAENECEDSLTHKDICSLIRKAHSSGVHPDNWVGCAKTLTLFMTKLFGFSYPIYDLTKNLFYYLWLLWLSQLH